MAQPTLPTTAVGATAPVAQASTGHPASSPPTSADQALRARARRVVPGGMTGHLNAASLPTGYPQFFARGQGCRLWDVDGREYIDFMCGWGPNLLGYRHPEVEAAAQAQAAQGDCLNGPTERFVELAEALVDTIAHADWVMFQKNGTDATTVALMVARAATGRRKVLAAHGSYHGATPWCTPVPAGTTVIASTPISRNRKWLPPPSASKLFGMRSSMTKRHCSPSFTAAASVMRQWLLCGAPQVTSVSQPWAIASATRNSSLRVLLPPGERPSRSSRLIHTSGPRPPGQLAASAALKRGSGSMGVAPSV